MKTLGNAVQFCAKKVLFWSDKYLELNIIQTQILIQYYKTLLQGMPVLCCFINKRLLIWAGLMFFYDHYLFQLVYTPALLGCCCCCCLWTCGERGKSGTTCLGMSWGKLHPFGTCIAEVDSWHNKMWLAFWHHGGQPDAKMLKWALCFSF